MKNPPSPKLPAPLRAASKNLNQATTLVASAIAVWPKDIPLSYRYYVAKALGEAQNALNSLGSMEACLRTRAQNEQNRAAAIAGTIKQMRKARRAARIG